MSEQFLTISQFAKEIGVTPLTIKRWEKKGLLYPHHTSPTGYRYYTYEQVEQYKAKYYKKHNDVLTPDADVNE